MNLQKKECFTKTHTFHKQSIFNLTLFLLSTQLLLYIIKVKFHFFNHVHY